MIDVQVLRGSTVRDQSGVLGRIESINMPWIHVGWIDPSKIAPRMETYRRGAGVMEGMDILTVDRGWIPVNSLIGTKQKATAKQLIADLEHVVSDDVAESVVFAPLRVWTVTSDGQSVKQTVESVEQLRTLFNALEEATDDREISFKMSDLPRVYEALDGSLELLDMNGEPLTEEGSHHPFKRWSNIGIGPRDDANAAKGRWKCKCSNYLCKCVGSGDRKGTSKTVRIKRSYKKAYNKEYKAWRAKQEPGYEPSGGPGKSGRGR